MIFQHYRELVRPKDAKRWVSITPGTDGKIVWHRDAALNFMPRVAEGGEGLVLGIVHQKIPVSQVKNARLPVRGRRCRLTYRT